MKKIILYLSMFCASAAMAQQYSSVLDIDKMKPGKMIFGDGKEVDVMIKYQMPELFKNPQNKFTISVDGGEPYTHSGGIESFSVDGNIWALRNVPVKTDGYAAGARQFVIMTRQGAIEQYSYVYYGKPSDDVNMAYTDLFKNRLRVITRKVSTNEFVEGVLSEEKLREWIADSPEAKEDLKKAEAQAAEAKKRQEAKDAEGSKKEPAPKGKLSLLDRLENASVKESELKQEAAVEIDMFRIINNYNAYYEQSNPSKTKYYFASSPSVAPLPGLAKPVKTREEIAAESEAKKDALFAGRTSTPSADIASVKDNVPVKKETFAAKMDRIMADGNKVGVVLYLKPAMTPKPAASSSSGPSMMMKQAMPSDETTIEGEYWDESLLPAGEDLAKELNAALGRSDIETIDLVKIPYRDLRFGRIDDWWATKYKVVFAYTLDPRIMVTKEESKGEKNFSASLNMIGSLVVTEFIGGPDATKQDIQAQSINFGSFLTESYTQQEEMKDIQDVYSKLIAGIGTPILEKIKSERADAMNKLVEKKLK